MDSIIEERIQVAIARGDFADLPGQGKPLELDDDLLVPPEVRVANRVLKNSGYIPQSVRDLATLRALLDEIAHAQNALTPARRAASRAEIERLAHTLETAGLARTVAALRARGQREG